ncbi:unnamed protein product [Rangifer tarandus platyrhynchus]|uniref:Uncharacterized protein n=2 Tax=Rangifer tarandus platyrhynchus TaxID=3082113 RepID=A0ACB0EMT4_RANTA|nr:unnamed protein product [Rangifer tarandus platyrhynchus]CAI9701980.1 unnamed protein product [Rangifer tarandus platyrhynchus]
MRRASREPSPLGASAPVRRTGGSGKVPRLRRVWPSALSADAIVAGGLESDPVKDDLSVCFFAFAPTARHRKGKIPVSAQVCPDPRVFTQDFLDPEQSARQKLNVPPLSFLPLPCPPSKHPHSRNQIALDAPSPGSVLPQIKEMLRFPDSLAWSSLSLLHRACLLPVPVFLLGQGFTFEPTPVFYGCVLGSLSPIVPSEQSFQHASASVSPTDDFSRTLTASKLQLTLPCYRGKPPGIWPLGVSPASSWAAAVRST